MSNLSIKRFSWLRTPSAWESTQAWRSRQQDARDKFESANASASTNFFSASTNLVTGMGSITAQVASQRIQQQAVKAALNKLA